ncbi:MAG: MATE family efflux transporter [Eubacteriales bacterium]|jgi:putative MATE family efflux protein
MLHFLKRGRSFYKNLAALALPLVLQNLINSSLALVDTAMVGMLGQNELAGVSLSNTPFFVAMLFVFGIQSGGAVLISQYWGKRDMMTINRVMGISLYFAGAISFLFALIITLFPEFVMGLTTNNPVLLDVAVRYGRIVAFSYFINSVSMVYTGAHRSTENPKLGMFILAGSMILNTFLNWVLIFGKLGFPALGVEGAAISTLISRIFELLVTIVYAVFFDRHLTIIPKKLLMPGKEVLKDFIKYATPVVMNETLWGLGFSMLPIIYGHMENSADVVAASSVSGNVERIVAVLTFAIANVSSIYIGKEIGSGANKEEVQRLGGDLLGISMLIGAFSGIFLAASTVLLVEPFVFEIFGLSVEARRISKMMLLVMSCILVIRSFNGTNIVGVLRGGGDVKVCMLMDVLPLYLYKVPIAAITALVLKWDIMWVYLLVVSEEFIKFTIGVLRYRSRKWINNITREIA